MHLGDVVLIDFPFLEVLRKARPIVISPMWIDEKLQDVMKYNPYIDDLITVDKKDVTNSIKGVKMKSFRRINATVVQISLSTCIPMVNVHHIWYWKNPTVK